MFTTGFKLYLAYLVAAIVVAVVYAIDSEVEALGVALLVTVAVVALFLCLMAIAVRDADIAEGEVGVDEYPTIASSVWPAAAGVGVGILAVGLVVDDVLAYVGLAMLAAVGIEWVVLAWADRSTGDPAYNKALRDHILQPLEFPIAGLAVVGLLAFALSRVLLALPANGATGIAIVLAAVIMGLAFLFSGQRVISRKVVTAVLLLGGLGIIAGGIVAAAVGERDFEHEEDDGSSTSEESSSYLVNER